MKKIDSFIKANTTLLLGLLVLIGAYLRFVSLDWGNTFLHPDELNIGFAVSRIYLPENANPEFFAYGSFPIYITYFISVLQNFLRGSIDLWYVSLEQALVIGRHLSALTSTALIPLTYLLVRKLEGTKQLSLFAALLSTFVIGFIQFAHFATFEIFLTFFYLLIVLVSLHVYQKNTYRLYVLLGLLIGLTVGTKIVSLYLLGIPHLILFLQILSSENKSLLQSMLLFFHPKKIFHLTVLTAIVTAICIFFVVNPFIILDFDSFSGSLDYEQGVATGSLPVFYTRNFLETIPVYYQYFRVLPFISGYVLRAVGIIAVITLLIYAIQRLRDNHKLVLFLYVFGGYTIFHLTMFVKWTRYMTPVLLLLIPAVVLVIQKLYMPQSHRLFRGLLIILLLAISFETVFRGLSFSTLYAQQDTRQLAAAWLAENTTSDDVILSEVFDPNVIPFNETRGTQIDLFNMYELDELPGSHETFANYLEESDYILLPSDRVYASAMRLPHRFPIASTYYDALFSKTLGFELVYMVESRPCLISTADSPLPEKVLEFLCPINNHEAEGTFYVFDHPTVMVFKKIQEMSVEDYVSILKP